MRAPVEQSQAGNPSAPPLVFFSHSDADDGGEWAAALADSLADLAAQGRLRVWFRERVRAGEPSHERAIGDAALVVFVITKAFRWPPSSAAPPEVVRLVDRVSGGLKGVSAIVDDLDDADWPRAHLGAVTAFPALPPLRKRSTDTVTSFKDAKAFRSTVAALLRIDAGPGDIESEEGGKSSAAATRIDLSDLLKTARAADGANELLHRSVQLAASAGSATVTTRALLAALLEAGRIGSDERAQDWLVTALGQTALDRWAIVRQRRYPVSEGSRGSTDVRFASPELASALGLAFKIAEETCRSARFYERHLLAALLVQEAPEPTNAHKLLRELGSDPRALRDSLFDALPGWRLHDNLEAWRRWLVPNRTSTKEAPSPDGPRLRRVELPPLRTYVAYTSRDSDAVLPIVAELREAGFPLWIDQVELNAGDRWEPLIDRVRSTSVAWLFFVGPHGRGPQNELDVEVASRRLQSEKEFPIFPILLPNASSNDLPHSLKGIHAVRLGEKNGARLQAFADTLEAALRRIARRRPLDDHPPADDDGWSPTVETLTAALPRLALRDIRVVPSLAVLDAATLLPFLREIGVTTREAARKLEAELAREYASFQPDPLWVAWASTAHCDRLERIVAEFGALPIGAPGPPSVSAVSMDEAVSVDEEESRESVVETSNLGPRRHHDLFEHASYEAAPSPRPVSASKPKAAPSKKSSRKSRPR